MLVRLFGRCHFYFAATGKFLKVPKMPPDIPQQMAKAVSALKSMNQGSLHFCCAYVLAIKQQGLTFHTILHFAMVLTQQEACCCMCVSSEQSVRAPACCLWNKHCSDSRLMRVQCTSCGSEASAADAFCRWRTQSVQCMHDRTDEFTVFMKLHLAAHNMVAQRKLPSHQQSLMSRGPIVVAGRKGQGTQQ